MSRQLVSTGTVWEGQVGYSRAVRIGNHIAVSGTIAADAQSQVVGAGNSEAQARFIFNKIEQALVELGSCMQDVIRTRMYVTDITAHSEGVMRAHGERFGDIRPASTLVEARLISPEFLVEIEVDAIVDVSA